MAAVEIRARIAALRDKMAAEGIDLFLIPTEDYHRSEYVADYFKEREFFSGFTGSAGTLVVGRAEAAQWADGRYFVQAAAELEGSGILLMKMGEPGVPTIREYIRQNLPEKGVLAFDGRCVSSTQGEEFLADVSGKGGSLRTDLDPAEGIWTDRPAMPCHPVTVMSTEYSGESTPERLGRLRAEMEKAGCRTFVTSRLDELMWLLNIRGGDVECNPVALSHGVVDMDRQYLFVQEAERGEAFDAYAAQVGLEVLPYDAFADFLRKHEYTGNVMCDSKQTSYETVRILQEACAARGFCLVSETSPLERFKAVKNDVEMRHIRDCYRADSAAVCRFIRKITQRVRAGEALTEMDAAQMMDDERRALDGFLDLSFGTISAYGPNAAMMHYEATPGCNAQLKPEGMLLVDSGGQYLTGTTDVTRTTALGPVTEEMRRHYTLTAESNLRLMDAVFMDGCTGANLDILAREPMWREGMDYKCGTGHGIGFVLNVHETPPSIRWRFAGGGESKPLQPGMIVSDEPGVYKEGKYGIRIETILEVCPREVTGDGTFLCFSPLTLVPLDRELLDFTVLSPAMRDVLNAYHARVREEIMPLLDGEDAQWLYEQTKPL